MHRRRILPILLVVTAAAACGTIAESPTEAPSIARAAASDGDEDPPPPPVDTGDINVDGSAGGEGGGSVFSFEGVSARYFANKQGTNAWLQFFTGAGVIASPNARLQYNEKSRKTNGQGTLFDTRTLSTLNLASVRIVAGAFGACDGSVLPPPSVDRGRVGTACGFASFTSSAGPGFLTVSKRTPIVDGEIPIAQ